MDMTQGNYKKNLLIFAVPIIISLITQQLYNVMDAVIVGRFLGNEMLSAVGNAGSVLQVFTIICGGFEMGSEIVFSKYLGEKAYGKIISGTKNTFLFAGVAAVFLTGICLFGSHQIFTWIHLPEELFAYTESYFAIYCGGFLFVFLLLISNAVLLSLGDSKSVMLISLFTSVLNIGLDLLFIGGCSFGIRGAAVATILSQFAGMLISIFLLRRKLAPFAEHAITGFFQPDILKEILAISLPSMVQQFALTFGDLLLQSLVNTFGSQVISGYVVISKLMVFGLVPVIGISQAVSVFTSTNYGRKNFAQIKKGYAFSLCISFFYLLMVDMIFLFCPKLPVTLFLTGSSNQGAIHFACHYLTMSIFAYLFTGVKYIGESILRGLGQMRGFLCANLSDLAVKIGASYAFATMLQSDTFWVGNLCGRVTAAVVSSLLLISLVRKEGASADKNHCQKTKHQ